MSTSRTLLIEPRDPVIFRDGKPFSVGLGARSVDFATPSAVIGAIRSRSGASAEWTKATVDRVLEIEQCGPFLASGSWDGDRWSLAFPAPADVVAYKLEGSASAERETEPLLWCPLRPHRSNEGCDLPSGLLPLLGAKPEKVARELPTFWHWERMEQWLAYGGSADFQASRKEMGIQELLRHRRTHVSIDSGTQSAEEGMLFTTEGLEFSAGATGRLGIVTRISNAMDTRFEAVSHIGGEGRTALWSEPDSASILWPSPPDWLREKKFIRLVLATPGAFNDGYRPAWFKTGEVPGCNGLKLTLRAAAVNRGIPLSGWDMENNRAKASRLLAPAGSVYFCEVEGDGDPSQLWMKSIADDKTDRRAGFGIVLVGDWSWQEN